jgi:hypothetical protein
LSNRAVAKKLGIDEGTVRRMLLVDALPEAQKQAIHSGVSTNQILRECRETAPTTGSRERNSMISEASVEEYVDQVSQWLRKNQLSRAYAERVLLDIDGILFATERHNVGSFGSVANDVPSVIRACRPATLADANHFLNPFVKWGAAWIRRAVPRNLRDKVISEASRRL